MEQLWKIIWDGISDKDMFSHFRFLLFILSSIIVSGTYLKIHFSHKKKKIEDEERLIEEIFEKDEDGFYPWEKDIDDSPNRIEKNAKPLKYDWRPSRGRWR